MGVFKNMLADRFFQLPNELIEDKRISAKAFRVAAYLFSKPSNWEVVNSDIMKRLCIKDSASLAKYWKELLDSGWLTRSRTRDEKGNYIGGYDYQLNLMPEITESGNNPNREKTHIRKKSTSGKTPDTLSNTDFISNTNNKSNNEFPANADFSENSILKKAKKEEVKKTSKSETAAVGSQSPKSTKWESGIFKAAQEQFDEKFRKWQLVKNKVAVNDEQGIYWNKKEIGQLGNLLKAIRHYTESGLKEEITQTQLVNEFFPRFLDKAITVDPWFMDTYTPTKFFSRFNDIISVISTAHKSRSNGYQAEIIDSNKYAELENAKDIYATAMNQRAVA